MDYTVNAQYILEQKQTIVILHSTENSNNTVY